MTPGRLFDFREDIDERSFLDTVGTDLEEFEIVGKGII